jgi:glycosyltransferase involved in cell wall biosynthesis
MKPTAIVTIVSNNYLHFARTLLQSVALHHPEAARYCVIVDRDPAPSRELAEEFEAIELSALALPDGQDFFFQYTVLELNTAVKPWAMQHLLNQGHERVFYIDPDIRLYQPLSEVQDLLGQGADIVFTPHLLDPITDDYRPTELDIRRAGTYNLGFCAVRNTPNTHRYLQWWQGKLHRHCIVEVDKGIFVDQSWMDLVPGLFDRVAVLRHPGYNIAYWNLAQRTVSTSETGQVLVNGQPLAFFHYSGLNPQAPHNVSKHQNRFTLDTVNPTTRRLFQDYASANIANGAARYSQLPYGFDQYTCATPITAAERARFRTDETLRQQCQGQPFDHPELLSPRHMPAGAARQQLHIDPAHTYRLQFLYTKLLGRLPERAALAAFGPRMGSKPGMLRTVLAVGLSREARATAGWPARLVHLANEVHFTPSLAKRWLVQPTAKAMQAASAIWPALAWRPPGAQIPPSVADTHLVVRPQRVAQAPHTAASQLPAPQGINLVGYLSAELGVGEAARSLARACAAVQIPFSATDVGYQSQNLQRDTSILPLAQAKAFPIDLLYVNADQTAATTQQLQASGRSQPAYTIGFWHWEQPELPAHLHSAFAHVDEVWVPSTFVQDAVASVSPMPVFKVPHALQFEPTPGVQRSQFGLPQDRQLVLVMYDFHSYQHRKNPQAAIAAYRLAAQSHPQLTLVIKTINSQHHPQAFAQLQASVQDLPQVVFINDFLTRQQTWDLQHCCDILLSLHRAEGFGLAPAEMMYLGKPVVATGWSANMDFMTPANSLPVRYQLQPLAQAIGAYPAGPLWAEADTEHAAWCLSQLAAQPELAQRLGAQAASDIRRQLSPAAVGAQIRQRLQMLGHWHPNLLANHPS